MPWLRNWLLVSVPTRWITVEPAPLAVAAYPEIEAAAMSTTKATRPAICFVRLPIVSLLPFRRPLPATNRGR